MARNSGQIQWVPAFLMALVQVGLFTCVYSGCLDHTAARNDVGRLVSDWERAIPLIPAMIVPYLSIYPLFVMSFFVCRGSTGLRTLGLQLLLAQLVAGACYIAFPLECAFQRPPMTGAFGMLFGIVDATDLPYNLAPSLHVTMSVILGRVFVARLGGRWGAAGAAIAGGWFVLIAISTMLTWQHHVVDVVGGAMLGLLCTRVSAEECMTVQRFAAIVRNAAASSLRAGFRHTHSRVRPWAVC